jgi:hypothetical protein
VFKPRKYRIQGTRQYFSVLRDVISAVAEFMVRVWLAVVWQYLSVLSLTVLYIVSLFTIGLAE